MRIPKYVYFNPFFRLCRSVSHEPHVFVVGAPRSGTTLIANVISNHSNICSLNSETALFSWRNNFLLFEGKAGRHSSEFNALRRQCKDVVELFERLANEAKTTTHSKRFLEKTPQHVFNLRFILNRFPAAKVVHILRDPRDCYVSARSNPSVPQKSPAPFAKYWKRCVTARNRFTGHASIRDLRYEALCSEPAEQVSALMTWLGEEFEPQQLDPEKMSKDPRAGSAAFRLLGKPISPESVGRWKTELGVRERETIERIAGPYMSSN